MVDTVIAVLIHPCQAARLAAAWCLRCICVAVPSQITPLIDRCVDGLENRRNSPEAISGYSSALAAVLGSVRLSPLGVPHTKGKVRDQLIHSNHPEKHSKIFHPLRSSSTPPRNCCAVRARTVVCL